MNESEAFDNVSHSHLHHNFHKRKIDENYLVRIENFVDDKQTKLRMSDYFTNYIRTVTKISQDSIISVLQRKFSRDSDEQNIELNDDKIYRRCRNHRRRRNFRKKQSQTDNSSRTRQKLSEKTRFDIRSRQISTDTFQK